jgi:phosphatidylinositol alpha-1,6-mannosyltransferase
VLEALGRLDTGRRKAVRYVIAGPVVDPDFETRLRRLANSGGVDVIFTGDIDDDVLSRHYAGADIFAMTSEPQANSVEGFGLAFLEASAAGLPILGYRTGGVEEAVQDGRTGLLVEPGDMGGLVGALTRLIDDAALRERLGENGRQWAAKFSWESCATAVYGDLP